MRFTAAVLVAAGAGISVAAVEPAHARDVQGDHHEMATATLTITGTVTKTLEVNPTVAAAQGTGKPTRIYI
jgi:hypothetical protein